MPTRSNEQLCRLAQKGDTAARDILLEKNLGFIRKIALEQYRNMGLDENDIGIDLDDLMQEGSIGLLNAIPLFDAGRGMRGLCTCSAVYSVVKGQRKKSSFLTAMTKTGDLSCLYCDLFKKNILPCPFIEAADSAISLQAQQNRYYRT